MDPQTEIAIQVQIGKLQVLVEQGFSSLGQTVGGINTRLDTLNGRVYTGEQDRSALASRVSAIEGRLEGTPVALSKTKITGIAAAAGGVLLTAWEFLKPFLSHFKPTP
jgi:hypothetical protein